jgi:hypothetical protein
MGAFIVKRKKYADPNTKYSFWEGKQIQNAKGFKANAANMANLFVAPGAVAGMIAENARGKMDAAIDDFKETAQNYTPTVQNSFVNPQQKQYGVVQAVKEVGTGVGKGLWNWGKKNKGSLGGLVGFGALMGAGTYGMNRIQRQKAEIESGEREANGMSTGGKVTAGATALGTGGYMAYRAGKSHDKAVNELKDTIKKNDAIRTESMNAARKAKSAGNPNAVVDKFGRTNADIVKQNTKIARTANLKSVNASKELANKTGTKFGMSKKAFKMTRNGLLTGGLVAGAGLLANKMLRQKNNSAYGAAKRIASKALGGKSIGKAIADGDWKNLGKAAGAYSHGVSRGVSNFFTPGKGGAGGIMRSVENNLKKQGEYGKKAADFIGRHRTAVGIGTAATVGSGLYNVTNSIGEKGVGVVANTLDKKTADYVKSKEGQV